MPGLSDDIRDLNQDLNPIEQQRQENKHTTQEINTLTARTEELTKLIEKFKNQADHYDSLSKGIEREGITREATLEYIKLVMDDLKENHELFEKCVELVNRYEKDYLGKDSNIQKEYNELVTRQEQLKEELKKEISNDTEGSARSVELAKELTEIKQRTAQIDMLLKEVSAVINDSKDILSVSEKSHIDAFNKFVSEEKLLNKEIKREERREDFSRKWNSLLNNLKERFPLFSKSSREHIVKESEKATDLYSVIKEIDAKAESYTSPLFKNFLAYGVGGSNLDVLSDSERGNPKLVKLVNTLDRVISAPFRFTVAGVKVFLDYAKEKFTVKDPKDESKDIEVSVKDKPKDEATADLALAVAEKSHENLRDSLGHKLDSFSREFQESMIQIFDQSLGLKNDQFIDLKHRINNDEYKLSILKTNITDDSFDISCNFYKLNENGEVMGEKLLDRDLQISDLTYTGDDCLRAATLLDREITSIHDNLNRLPIAEERIKEGLAVGNKSRLKTDKQIFSEQELLAVEGKFINMIREVENYKRTLGNGSLKGYSNVFEISGIQITMDADKITMVGANDSVKFSTKYDLTSVYGLAQIFCNCAFISMRYNVLDTAFKKARDENPKLPQPTNKMKNDLREDIKEIELYFKNRTKPNAEKSDFWLEKYGLELGDFNEELGVREILFDGTDITNNLISLDFDIALSKILANKVLEEKLKEDQKIEEEKRTKNEKLKKGKDEEMAPKGDEELNPESPTSEEVLTPNPEEGEEVSVE